MPAGSRQVGGNGHRPVQTSLSLILDTNRLTMAIPSSYVSDVREIIKATWHKNRRTFVLGKVVTSPSQANFDGTNLSNRTSGEDLRQRLFPLSNQQMAHDDGPGCSN